MITPKIIELLKKNNVNVSRQNVDYWKKKLLTPGVDYEQHKSATVFTPEAAKIMIKHFLQRGNINN